jgi:hypothetical protein
MSANAEAVQPRPVPLLPPRRRRRWLTVLLGLVILGCGAIIGAGVALVVVRDRVLYALRHPEEMPARVTARLRRTLGLTEQQTEKVRVIVERRHAALQMIRRFVQPRVEAQLENFREDVAAVLSPPQAEAWRSHFDALRRTWVPPLPPLPRMEDNRQEAKDAKTESAGGR